MQVASEYCYIHTYNLDHTRVHWVQHYSSTTIPYTGADVAFGWGAYSSKDRHETGYQNVCRDKANKVNDKLKL